MIRRSHTLRLLAGAVLVLGLLGVDECGESTVVRRDLSVGPSDFDAIDRDPLLEHCPGLQAQFLKRHPRAFSHVAFELEKEAGTEDHNLAITSSSLFFGLVERWGESLSSRSNVTVRAVTLHKLESAYETFLGSLPSEGPIFQMSFQMTIDVTRKYLFTSEEMEVLLAVSLEFSKDVLAGGVDLSGQEEGYLRIGVAAVESRAGLEIDTALLSELMQDSILTYFEWWNEEQKTAEVDFINAYSLCLQRVLDCPEGTIALSNPLPVDRSREHNEFLCEKGELFRDSEDLERMRSRDEHLHGPWMRVKSSSLAFTTSEILGQRLLRGTYEDGQRVGEWAVCDAHGNAVIEASLIPLAGSTHDVHYAPPSRNARTIPIPEGALLPPAPDMTYVSAGNFYTGCNLAKEGDCSDRLAWRKEWLPAFYIDRFEATARQYAACVEAGICEQLEEPGTGDTPVTGATALQAHRFCQHRGKRLPTELEWEKAARGGCDFYENCSRETRMYTWGDAEPGPDLVRSFYGARDELDSFRPVAGGQSPMDSSPYGVFDLTANVQEMTAEVEERAEHNAYLRDCADGECSLDGSVAVKGKAPNRKLHTLSSRSRWGVSGSDPWVGFRCARSPNAARTPRSATGRMIPWNESDAVEDSPRE